MTNKKTTLRALLLSLISVLACVAMLVGSTFAWFTDSVSSMNNIIKSGNLDVVVEYKTNWADSWAELEADDKLFSEENLYEPGYTKVVFLRVSNAGSLALKYKLAANIVSEKASTNVYGEEFKLSDYLQIGVYTQAEYSSGANYADILMPIMFGTREAARNSVATSSIKLADFGGVAANDVAVLPGDDTAQVMALVLYMPEEVGNEANHKTGVAAPEITFGLNVLATQMMHEDDSFGPDYDADAEYPTVVNTAAQLVDALAAGEDVVLSQDIVLDAAVSIPAGVAATIDLNGNDLSAELDAAASMITNNGELTIQGDGEISVTYTGAVDNGKAVNAISNRGKLTINGGKISNTANGQLQIGYAIDNYNGAELTVNGGEIVASGSGYYDAIRLFCGSNETVVTINGGTVSSIWSQNPSAGKATPVKGTVIINGGDVAATYYENYTVVKVADGVTAPVSTYGANAANATSANVDGYTVYSYVNP